ncbi:MAG: hypothetical protein R2824_17725 [Saprospiraceae bacterium]|nr:hypothetical protein [Lewinella sp.]
MEYSKDFHLQSAILQYIQRIDLEHLLDQDEREELFDHLLSETEALMETGLSEREALAVSKLRFGEIALISQQYEQVKPLGSVRKNLISGIMLFFMVTGLSSLLQMISIGSLVLFDELQIAPTFIRILDFGIKFMVFGGLLAYAITRIRQRQLFRSYELWLIPILGLLSPLALSATFLLGSPYMRLYQGNLMSHFFLNTGIVVGICMTTLALIYYFILYRDRKEIMARS